MENVLNIKKAFILCVIAILFSINGIAQKLHKGFSYVKEEIPTIVLELRYASNHNFIGKPIDGYLKPVAILSSNAVEALKKVQAELAKKQLGLKIYDAYRPQTAVNHFMRWALDLNDTINKAEFYPNVDKKNLFKDGYIASRSGHSRGSTIDITIVNLASPNKEELDMGSPYDFFGEKSWIQYPKLTAKQRENRELLQRVMKKYNFANYPKEWWHFTLKNEPFPETYFDFPIE
ncbi:M15 family metallopeptidase [Lutibacter sp.]